MSAPTEENPAADLERVLPQAVVVQLSTGAVEIRALTLGELPVLLGKLREAGGVSLGNFDPIVLLVEQPALAIDVVAILTRQPPAQLQGMALDDVAALLLGAVEANRSFFVRYGLQLLEAVGRVTAAAGQSLSPG